MDRIETMLAPTRYQRVRGELEAVASCELASELAAWADGRSFDAARLRDYLRDELGQGGLLSLAHMREAGAEDARAINAQAVRLLARLDGPHR